MHVGWSKMNKMSQKDFKTTLENRYIETHVTKRLPANWKASAEAFLEAYHVLETHSEGIYTAGDANADYDIFGDHITRFVHTIGYTSPHVTKNRPDEQGILNLLLGRRLGEDSEQVKVPEGKTAREIYAQMVQEEMGEKYKSDFSHLSVTETIDSIEYFVFPNAFFCLFAKAVALAIPCPAAVSKALLPLRRFVIF